MKAGISIHKIVLFVLLITSINMFSQMPSRPVVLDEPEEEELGEASAPELPYEFKNDQSGNLSLNKPTEIEVTYDAKMQRYVIRERVGNYYVSFPKYLTQEEYMEYRLKQDILSNYKEKLTVVAGKTEESKEAQKDLLPTYYVNSGFFTTIFGSNEIDINPTGNIQLKLGVLHQNVENPQISERNRKSTTFDFDQQITASVNAKIGTRLGVIANYDTESTFDFQNQVKLEYSSEEDDIIQKIEVGNVSMPVKNSLVSGAQNLFGFKTELQFGKTKVTGVFAEQKSQTKTVAAQGGSSITEFELKATDYDADKHYFLSQSFRDNYDTALENFPLINSQINIVRMEVWVTNRQSSTADFRNIVAIADLGEYDINKYGPGNVAPSPGFQIDPSNEANSLNSLLTQTGPIRNISTVSSALAPYSLSQGTGYSILENARKLEPREYKFNPQLGYITLNRRMGEADVLAVAYEYTITGSDEVHRVGEFSTDGIVSPANLVVKLLRSEIINTSIPVWDLMMKNIYSLGAYQMSVDGFRFELLYRNDETGVSTNVFQNAATPGVPDKTLLNIFKVDRLDQNQNFDNNGDGYFDYIEGITVNSENGYVIFPTIEPFGESLDPILTDPNDAVFIFDELYTNTKAEAQNNYQSKDKYFLKGYTKSDGSAGIPLGAYNVPQGSVTVTTGGRELVEGVDYVVDYQIGRVQIINPALEASESPIEVSVENNSVFSLQTKRFMGVDVEHKFSDKFVAGATVLNLRERPLTQKVNTGSETINNTIFGLRADYATEVPAFTRLVNKLPNLDTDAESNFSIKGDFAYLRPGASKQVELNGEATSYIDDFEGAQIPLDLKAPQQWYFSSAPVGFGGEKSANDISAGFGRARLAWYNIDQLFYGSSSIKPGNIDADELSRAEVRRVKQEELFPAKDLDITQTSIVRTLDLAYFPNERGSYNYDSINVANGKLTNPQTRWGGITRPMTVTNFYQSNIEYIQFWMQDPYQNYSITEEEGLDPAIDPKNVANQVGDLYFNLGNISEDVLKDDRKQYENGLPATGGVDNTLQTTWAKIPTNQSLLYTFDTDDTSRINQDVGFDGMNDNEERTRHQDPAFDNNDPSSDNYRFYRGSQYDNDRATILTRYKAYNNTDGNSPTTTLSPESYPTSATNYPDVEDIDKDQTMNSVDSYFEYKISMNANDFVVGQNNIVDEKTVNVELEDGTKKDFRWLQFRIPIAAPTNVINGISNFNSIRYMRMFVSNFNMPVVLRFGELQLIRGEWRRYDKEIDESDNPSPPDLPVAELENLQIGVVNVEENEFRTPIPYVVPPGIEREQLQGTTKVQFQNEQSLTMKVVDLPPGETRAVFKNVVTDLRMYKKLKMFVHIEGVQGKQSINDGDFLAIIRLGSDTNDNYYQIEYPLKVTPFTATTAEDIWPNDFDVILKELGELKIDRYNQLGNNVINTYPPYVAGSRTYTIRVKGNPNLGNVRTIMLGAKNASTTNSLSAELWFDELRTAEFDNDGGWAAVVTADTNFADFADVSVTGRVETIGFGGIEETLNERSQEDTKQYDLVSNINIGKLLPSTWGIQLPINYNIAEEFHDPKYDNKYQDVLFNDAKDANPNSSESTDHTKRTSISLMNVRKERVNTEKKPHFYDVENLSVSYSHNEQSHQDYNIEKAVDKSVRASGSYNFAFQAKSIEPFKKLSDKKSLRLLTDFNFNLLPSTISINSNIIRSTSEQKSRSLVENLPPLPTLRQNKFSFDWDYSIGYNITKSIQFTFTAMNNYVSDIDSDVEVDIYDKFFSVDRPDHYHQTFSLTYQIPIDKVPGLEFLKSNIGYNADYDWKSASLSYIDQVGNTIQNANTINFSADADMVKLYRGLGLTKSFKKRTVPGKVVKTGEKDDNGDPITKQLPDKRKKGSEVGVIMTNLLMMIKKVRGTYSQRNGTMLGGYIPTTGFLGRDNHSGGLAPTLGFVFGDQADIRYEALENGWLISRNINDPNNPDDPYYNRTYSQTHSNQLDVFLNITPFRDFDIEMSGRRTYTKNIVQQSDVVVDYSKVNPSAEFAVNPISEVGNFSTSFNMIGTSFADSDQVFEAFKSNRAVIAERLANSSGANISGFGLNNQEVMLPAFVAAYKNQAASGVSTEAFLKMPLPNWKITYKGLMRVKWFKKRFQTVALSHGYRSLYAINNYTNNLNFDANNPYGNVDIAGNYENELLYSSVNVVEDFSPLIKVDLKLRNSFSVSAEMKKDRMLNLNFNNNTLTEQSGKEYIIGAGYRFKNLKVKFKFNQAKKTINGDLNIRMDIGIRDNETLIRDIDIDNNQVTGGQRLFTFKFLADYALSRSLTASFYFDQNSAKYAVSTSFPRKSFNTGIAIQYNLGN